MVDKSLIGTTDDPIQMPVEWGKIREFARATMTSNPAYLEDPNAVSEPTFLTTTNFWQTGTASPVAKLGLDLKRVLHGGQEYVFHGPPPRAGTNLTVQTRIEDMYEKEGKRGGTMTFVVVVTDFTDETGKLVAEARSTVIETGRPPKEEA